MPIRNSICLRPTHVIPPFVSKKSSNSGQHGLAFAIESWPRSVSMASFGSASARTAIWHPGSSIERPGFNQLSTSNYRLFGHSITSSSCVPSTSTLPETRSRPSAMWSQYRFSPHALLSEPRIKLDCLKQSSFRPAIRLSGSVSRLLVDLDTHMMLAPPDAYRPVCASTSIKIGKIQGDFSRGVAKNYYSFTTSICLWITCSVSRSI